ncbi:MAG TPA: hypothetical protein PK156_23495 [Polyangium sp.]|nr:hypothetical protein [Polyangium sp.]
MSSKHRWGLGWLVLAAFVACGGCLDLQTKSGSGGGGVGEASSSSDAASSSGGIGGSGGVSLSSSGSSGSSTSSSGTMATTVTCGAQDCVVPDECCHDSMTAVNSCMVPSSCPEGRVAIECDSAADCPGQICCGAFDMTTSKYIEVSCRTSCTAPNVVICSGSPSDCPAGTTCFMEPMLPSGYGYCQ